MKKVYVCQLSSTNIFIKHNGKVKNIEFEPDIISQYGLRGCSYTTDDKDIQSAIESHPQYRNGALDSIAIYGEPFSKLEKEQVKEQPKRVRRVKKEE